MLKTTTTPNLLLLINLQLFAENDTTEVSGDEDIVVDYPDDDVEMEEDVEEEFSDSEEGEELDEELTEPQEDDEDESKQTPQENAQFKKMRIKAEEQARKKLEAERIELQKLKQEIEESKTEKMIRDQHLSQQNIFDKADAEGVTEDVARRLLEAEVDKVIQSEKMKVKERFNAIQQQKLQYSKDKHFEEVDKLAQQAVDNNPNIDYHTAYKFFNYDIQKKYEGESEKNATKRTLANVQDRMKRRSVPSTNTAPVKTNLSSTTMEINNFLGIDSREVAQHKKKNAHRFKL